MVTISVYNAFGSDVSREDWLEHLGTLHLGTFGSLEASKEAIMDMHADAAEHCGVEVDPNGWHEVEPGVWHLDCYEIESGDQLAGFYEIKRDDVDM